MCLAHTLNLSMNYINRHKKKTKKNKKRVTTFGSRNALWVRLPILSSNISKSGKRVCTFQNRSVQLALGREISKIKSTP